MHQQIIQIIDQLQPDSVRFITQLSAGTNFADLHRAVVIVHDGNETTHKGLNTRDFFMLYRHLTAQDYSVLSFAVDEHILETVYTYDAPRFAGREVVDECPF